MTQNNDRLKKKIEEILEEYEVFRVYARKIPVGEVPTLDYAKNMLRHQLSALYTEMVEGEYEEGYKYGYLNGVSIGVRGFVKYHEDNRKDSFEGIDVEDYLSQERSGK